MQLIDVVGIVTGGAAGFGKSFAEAILAAGGRVVITDINATALEATGAELAAKYANDKFAWTPQDVTDSASFPTVFEFATKHLGRAVNLLVNNAGIQGDASYLKEDSELEWMSVIEINLVSVMRGTQVALQQMRQNLNGAEGVVVNVASGAGLFALHPTPEYTASKHGVVGLTRACAAQKASCNVRVVALCPMFAKTQMGDYATDIMPAYVQGAGGLIDVADVTTAFSKAVTDEENAGQCLWISKLGAKYFPFPLSSAV